MKLSLLPQSINVWTFTLLIFILIVVLLKDGMGFAVDNAAEFMVDVASHAKSGEDSASSFVSTDATDFLFLVRQYFSKWPILLQ